MLNINNNSSRNLLERCPALKGYVTLVRYVREHQEAGDSLPDAMDKAIDRCTREGVLKEYLLKKKAEVKLMLLTEFDEELFAETMREEGREEGEDRLNQLYLRLTEEQKSNELARAMRDKGFRDTLYRKYGL